MELHDIPWNFMAFHGTPSLLHGTPWNSMAFHGIPWNSMELHGIPWKSMDTLWILHGRSVEFHGFPSISMEFHGGISHGKLALSLKILVRIASYGPQIDQWHGENRLSHIIKTSIECSPDRPKKLLFVLIVI